MNLSLCKDKIKKYDVISFDMYDTLIHRNVDTPDDIFFIVEHLYNKRISKNREKIDGFSKKEFMHIKMHIKSENHLAISMIYMNS